MGARRLPERASNGTLQALIESTGPREVRERYARAAAEAVRTASSEGRATER
jgi:hypothetical protein